MSSPLDDALRHYEGELTFQRSWRQQEDDRLQQRKERFNALVEDFLTRMNRAGNPGTSHDYPVGRFKKVRAWALTYELGDAWRSFLLTVDGRVPYETSPGEPVSSRRNTTLVPFTEAKRGFGTDQQLRQLGRSMAELLSQNGAR